MEVLILIGVAITVIVVLAVLAAQRVGKTPGPPRSSSDDGFITGLAVGSALHPTPGHEHSDDCGHDAGAGAPDAGGGAGGGDGGGDGGGGDGGDGGGE